MKEQGIFRLHGVVQHYAWGGLDFIPNLVDHPICLIINYRQLPHGDLNCYSLHQLTICSAIFSKFNKIILIVNVQLLIESQCLPPTQVIFSMAGHASVIIEGYENYQKRSFRNRIYFSGPQGTAHFTIPLSKGKHEKQNIKDVQIAYEENWIDQFYRILKTSYGSAPFYHHFADELLSILEHKFDN